MTDEPTSGVEAALTTLCNAVMADISEAKRRLDADIPKDAPVHPVSAFLTGTALHVGKARAALATPAASPASGVEAVLRRALEPFAEAGDMAQISGRPPGEHVDADAFIRARAALLPAPPAKDTL